MDADDIFERPVGAEAEFGCASGGKILRPAGDDFHNRFIGHSFDQRHGLFSGDAAQRLDLFCDGARNARHAQVRTIGQSCLIEAGSVQNARAKGQVRLEGKEYVMADGDVVEFRFNN